jgi:prepilin-type N-terminal cleavage/methylation domain-containing protein/prepilin-type processing-associated H-X9-DG protein
VNDISPHTKASKTTPSFAEAGFTLIELLVVIAIVSVLLSMALPSIGIARKAALETKSLGQLRQIGAAMHSYANDNNNLFPPGYSYKLEGNRYVERTYAAELLSYMSLPARFYEAVGNPFVSPTSEVPVRSGGAFTPFTYSVHGLLCGDISNGDRRVKRTAVERPSEVILVGDAPQLTNTYATANFSFPSEFNTAGKQTNLDGVIPVGPDTDVQSSRGYLRYRNRGKAAVLMVDGHAEMLKKGEVKYRHLIADR